MNLSPIDQLPDLMIEQILWRVPREKEDAIALTCKRWLNHLEAFRNNAENHVVMIDKSIGMQFTARRITRRGRVTANPIGNALFMTRVLTAKIFSRAYRGIYLIFTGPQLQTLHLKQYRDLVKIKPPQPGGVQEYLPALNAALSLDQNQTLSPTKTIVQLISNYNANTRKILDFITASNSQSSPIMELRFQFLALGAEADAFQNQLNQKRALEAEEGSKAKRQKQEKPANDNHS